LQKNYLNPVYLFWGYFDSGIIFANDSHLSPEWNDNTHLSNGNYLSRTNVEETTDIQINQATISLPGVDQTNIALVPDEKCIDRRLVILLGFIGNAGDLYAADQDDYIVNGYY